MAVEIKVPSPGESITEVEIATWHKQDGEYVNDGEELLEIESDKATLPVPAEGSGVLKILVEEGETVEVGAVVCIIDSAGAAPAESAPRTAAPAPDAQPASGFSNAQGVPSPAAAKILAEKGAAPASVAGTGPGGRILKADAMGTQAIAAKPASAALPPHPAGSRNARREKMSALRRKIAERLVAVKNDTAMLTTFNEVDLGEFMDVRKKYKELFKETHEVGLGFMSIFTKACCEALRKFPAVNAQIDGNEMVFHDYCDVAIAVSAPKGLMVPVIRNAESLTLDGIEKEVVRLAGKARTGSLSIDEMQGGTFTITNGGVFGSLMSTPIINPPQSAILGMHKIQRRPMEVNGEIKLRPMMYLALSYDHRIIDGKESVSFLVRVKELLEDPIRLLLGV